MTEDRENSRSFGAPGVFRPENRDYTKSRDWSFRGDPSLHPRDVLAGPTCDGVRTRCRAVAVLPLSVREKGFLISDNVEALRQRSSVQLARLRIWWAARPSPA